MCGDGKESYRSISKCNISLPPKSAMDLLKEAEDRKKKRNPIDGEVLNEVLK